MRTWTGMRLLLDYKNCRLGLRCCVLRASECAGVLYALLVALGLPSSCAYVHSGPLSVQALPIASPSVQCDLLFVLGLPSASCCVRLKLLFVLGQHRVLLHLQC